MEIRTICVGIDLYEFQIKPSLISSWKTVYSGKLPLRCSKKNIDKIKNQIIMNYYGCWR